MNLNELRRNLAPLLATTDDALLARQKAVSPVMKAEAEPADAFRQGATVPATPRNAAFIVLTAAVGGPPSKIRHRVERLWKSRYVEKGKTCPISNRSSLGIAIVSLIEDPVIRDQLDRLEVARSYRGYECASLVWRAAPASVFHPYSEREYRQKILPAVTTGLNRVAHIGGSVFAEIANLIARHKANERLQAGS
jgi:hypothetical protein